MSKSFKRLHANSMTVALQQALLSPSALRTCQVFKSCQACIILDVIEPLASVLPTNKTANRASSIPFFFQKRQRFKRHGCTLFFEFATIYIRKATTYMKERKRFNINGEDLSITFWRKRHRFKRQYYSVCFPQRIHFYVIMSTLICAACKNCIAKWKIA